MKSALFSVICFLSFSLNQLSAQNSGIINRQATIAAGRTILDPNGDGYTSTNSSGFGSSDVTNSELPYKPIPSFSIEPFGDLRRGPNHLYSDFVPDNNDDAVYLYFSGTNLLFRFRMGSIMSGSKGYSLLVDTDNRFGGSGTSADPNYLPATTGTNGNPGFEIEIVLETNSRIAIYNVDGTSSPVLIKSYTNWQDMSQVSVAGTFDNGDPDFFIDFYIPFSDLQAAPFNLTTNSDLRMTATTVMSPQAAIGGPKSDIYGLNDGNYASSNDEYEKYIKDQSPLKLSGLGSGFAAQCSAPPAITSPIAVGTVNVSGTWTKSTLSVINTATITVYLNGIPAGTVSNVASGSTWTLNNVAVADGNIITAKAQAAGESMCLVSNAVTANNCTPASRPPLPVLTCAGNYNKGVSGNNLTTGWVVYVENLTRGIVESTTSTPGQFTTSGVSPNIVWNYAGGCNGGPNMPSGSYRIYYMNASGCVSEPVFFCIASGGGAANNLAGTSAIPTITSPASLTPGTSSIIGSGEANSSVSLFVNGKSVQTVTASVSGSFTFSSLSLVNGDQVYITNILNTGTVNTSKCFANSAIYAVNCISSPPVIQTDNNNEITAGTAITGISSEPAGIVVRIYTSANNLVATTTVQSNGIWSTGNAGTTPGIYNSVAATNYYATTQNGTCSVSVNSGNASAVTGTASARCGTIVGPVSSSAVSISGTLNGTFTTTTVTLYLDGISIGSANTTTTSWGPVTVNTTINNTLYANGVLTIGIRETGKQEVFCPSSALTITCTSTPPSPIVSPTNFATTQNQQVTYTISNAQTGNFYGIADAATGRSLATGIWATSNGNLSITTNAFNSAGSYNIIVKATNLSGVTVCSSTPATATLAVSSTLPVTFLNISVSKKNQGAEVKWTVSNELNVAYYIIERSNNCIDFESIGNVFFSPGSTSTKQYAFLDVIPILSKTCYRILQLDHDGRSHYSRIVPVYSNNNYTIRISPNPVTHTATLYSTVDQDQHAILQIIDVYGRIISNQMIHLQTGDNVSTMEGLSSLPKGTYYIKLTGQNEIFYQKLIKQ